MLHPALRAAMLACVLFVPGVTLAQTAPQAQSGSPLPSVRLWGGYELSDPSGNLWGSAPSVVTLCPNTTGTGQGFAQVCPGSSVSNPLYVSGGGGSGGTASTVAQGSAGAAAWPVTDINSAAFQGVVAITPGTATTALRSLGFIVTTAGNVTLTLADASTITLPLAASPQFQTLPFAVTNVALGSGTAGTFWNLK